MVQCLETKLKEAVVNDGTLRKEGEMRINVYQVETPTYTETGTQRVEIYNDPNSSGNVMTCLGSGAFVNSSGTETGTRYPATGRGINMGTQVKNGTFQVSIDNKYIINRIKLFQASGLNLADLEGCTSLLNISVLSGKVYGDLLFLKDCPLSTLIEIQNSQISGDIKNLPVTVTQLYLSSNPNLYGNIASLGKHTSLNTVRFNYNAGISGSLEEFAQAQVDNGRTSGTIGVQGIDSNITYQGVPLTAHHTITFSNGSYTIS